MKTLLIAIEGSDGAGKETQSLMLADWFTKRGEKVSKISFPRYKKTAGGWALYEALKGGNADAYQFAKVDPYSASLLYAADRKESHSFLLDTIASHNVVIFDRYVESNLLHQGGKFATEQERDAFGKWLFDLEYGMLELPVPHVTIYLELPFEVTKERARMRALKTGVKLDSVEKDSVYVKNGHDAGIFYAKKYKWLRIPCVNDHHELTREEVHALLVKKLVSFLG